MDKQDLGIVAVTHTTSGPLVKLPKKATSAENFIKKKQRIRRELVKAGMTSYGLRKFNSHYLPTIIHNKEHIHGVIYGRFAEAPGLLSWVDRMVVATDLRIISLNHKPGYTDINEFTYDVIGSVDSSRAGPFTAVTIRTKVGNFSLRFTNNRCARIFMDYAEKRRLENYEEELLESKIAKAIND